MRLATLAGLHFGRDPLATLSADSFELLLLTAAVNQAEEMRQREMEAD